MQEVSSLILWRGMQALVILVFFLPTIIASGRRHPRQPAILVLNILLGWTIIGWVIALRWALREPMRPS